MTHTPETGAINPPTLIFDFRR